MKDYDKKVTQLWNVLWYDLQNPRTTNMIRINGIFYYPAKHIDRLQDRWWTNWRKYIEK